MGVAGRAGSPGNSGINNAATPRGSFSSQPTDLASLPGMEDLEAFVLEGLDALMPMDMAALDDTCTELSLIHI